MDITAYLLRRYTTKAFDPERRLDAAQLAQIETLLRYSPSSTNAQPWHFILAGSDDGKARIAQATQGFYSFNEAKIRRASHVVVLCTRAQIDDSHLLQVLAQEDQDGRFTNAEARAKASTVAAATLLTPTASSCATACTGWKNRCTWRWACCCWA